VTWDTTSRAQVWASLDECLREYVECLREYVCLLMQGANSERLLMRRSASARAGPRPRHDAEFVLDERELAVRQETM